MIDAAKFIKAILAISCLALLIFYARPSYADNWSYDWSTRLDRYGKPAGIFVTTPFPITESTTSYTIITDEGETSYQLGTRFFVDGAMPDDSGDGLSLATAKKTLSAAIEVAGDGNKTIIVRGAHDGFNGVYSITSALYTKAGIDNTHRWMIVGYNQERPILDANNLAIRGVIRGTYDHAYAYNTIQRLKIQNCAAEGIYPGNGTGAIDANYATIDVWLYNCTNQTATIYNGAIYYIGIKEGWIYHVTCEHTFGHGIKYGNLGGQNLVEWCDIKEIGYWTPWDGPTAWWGNHSTGLDFPQDVGQSADYLTIRYNIVDTTLYYGIGLRRTNHLSIHHNEIVNSFHCDGVQVTGCDIGSGTPRAGMMIAYTPSAGEVYSNVIRDEGAAGNVAFTPFGIDNTSSGLHFYNNQIYGYTNGVDCGSGSVELFILNNSIYLKSSGAAIYNISSGAVTVENNLIYQAGTGYGLRSLALKSNAHNRIYAPLGEAYRPSSLASATGNETANPDWFQLPSGSYRDGNFRLTKLLPGKVQASFSQDFLAKPRITWNKGSIDSSFTLSSPKNVRTVP